MFVSVVWAVSNSVCVCVCVCVCVFIVWMLSLYVCVYPSSGQLVSTCVCVSMAWTVGAYLCVCLCVLDLNA